MKLNSIILQNFKGIDNLEIKLDNKTTVIFGVNGVGKSTILQAIDLLYADIIAKLMGTVRSKPDSMKILLAMESLRPA